MAAESFEALLASALRVLDTDGEAALAEFCAAHPAHAQSLRAELTALRRAGLAGTLAESCAPTDTALPARVGPYTIVRRLGVGGMGEVFLAEQHEPLQRRVALKVVRRGAVGGDFVARFLVERQALSSMRHDGIAHVYDAGETADGQPYFAMEYVEGTSLTAYCETRALPLRARLELFCRVCDAVQHAHRQGVLHRDLKPGNVLVAEVDGRATPKVIDFGLAKLTDADRAHTVLTEAGQILGTPEYMSPEQAALEDATVDTRSDVYALGVILFELLTGRRPHEAKSSSGAALLELLHRIRTEDAPLPSTVGRSPSVSARVLRGDLDWIVLTALARDVSRRYAAVSDLTDDIRRYLAQQPIRARPLGAGYLLRKFVARHRVASLVAAIVLGSGVVLLARELTAARELAAWDQRFRKLALLQELRSLRREAEVDLLPISPGAIHDVGRLEGWLQRAEAMQQREPERRDDLEALRARGIPDGRGALTFADPRDQILFESLPAVVDELVALGKPGEVVGRVRRHLAWARAVHDATLVVAADAWTRATAAIADRTRAPAYRGLRIEPQLGLVPLRADPISGHWEFRLWTPTGVAPEYGETKPISNLKEADPIVVLLPGGTFWLGSQADDEAGPNHDPDSVKWERPPHRVTLAPFFLGKHELSQGQWQRWTGSNPAFWGPPRRLDTESFPVEQVSWTQCDVELRSWGLLLPTEAQWEYAARAGTTEPWWTGSTVASLGGKVNLADKSAKGFSVPNSWFHLDLDDGEPLPSRVDALAPNPFGLHGIVGNVWEWCRDPYCGAYPGDGVPGHAAGDGLLEVKTTSRQRPTRGGSYVSTSLFVRSANRLHRLDATAAGEQGVRIARPLLGAWTQDD